MRNSGGGTNKKQKWLDLVKILLDAGADVNVQTNDNETPLILANDFEYPEIVELIKNHIKEIKHKNLRTARLVTTMGKSKKNGSPFPGQNTTWSCTPSLDCSKSSF